jgi:hypothetical protein
LSRIASVEDLEARHARLAHLVEECPAGIVLLL